MMKKRRTIGDPTNRPVLAFFDRGNASYINSDLDLLKDHCVIKRWSFVVRRPWYLPFGLIEQLFKSLAIIPGSDVVFVHFAGWNSLLPLLVARLFGKGSVLFLHGTDSVSLPSIGYGNFRKKPLATVTCASLRAARHIVAVDGTLIRSLNTYAEDRPMPQGVMEHCRSLNTPTSVIAHGFAPDRWKFGDGTRDIDVLTVGLELHQEWRRQLKGVDLLIAVARRMPDRRFAVIGLPGDALKGLPPNLLAISEVPPSELIQWYQRSVCYAQLSMSEGFGCALAEAMLCGCIPLVSDVGAMPGIVGDTGVVVSKRDVDVVEAGLRQAMALDRDAHSRKARQRVMERLPGSFRAEGLKRTLERSL